MYTTTVERDGLGFIPFSPDLSQSFSEEDEFISSILDSSDSMETFMELGVIEEVKEEEEEADVLNDIMDEVGIKEAISGTWSSLDSDLESNQSLIDEVESYLQQVEGGSPTQTEEDEEMVVATEVNKSRFVDAERIFKALTSGNVESDWSLTEADLKDAFTTTIRGENGEDVIIIIAPSPPPSPLSPVASPYLAPSLLSPHSNIAVSSPGVSEACSESDYEWSPSPPASRHGQIALSPSRRKYQRKVRSGAPTGPYPQEKNERKKAQNRSAAYKYREKKRQEQDSADEQLAKLFERNAILKKRLNDTEVELRCLKKLMRETGLLTYF